MQSTHKLFCVILCFGINKGWECFPVNCACISDWLACVVIDCLLREKNWGKFFGCVKHLSDRLNTSWNCEEDLV